MFGTPASMLSISFPAAALSLTLSLFGEQELKVAYDWLRLLTLLRSNTKILKKRFRGIAKLAMKYTVRR